MCSNVKYDFLYRWIDMEVENILRSHENDIVRSSKCVKGRTFAVDQERQCTIRQVRSFTVDRV